MALGSDYLHGKAEYFDTASELWIEIEDYPYSNRIWGFASVFINGNFYIVGGNDWVAGDIIASLSAETWSWSPVGRLRAARAYHGAIWLNSKLIVVGGAGGSGWSEDGFTAICWPIDQRTRRTEICEWKNGRLRCVEQNAALVDYKYYPLLFAVPNKKNCSKSFALTDDNELC